VTRRNSNSGQIRSRVETSGLDSGESGPTRSLQREMSVEGISHPQTTTVILDQLGTELGQRQGYREREIASLLPLPNVASQQRPPFVVRGLSQPLNPQVRRQGDNTTLQSASSIQQASVNTRNSSLSGQIRFRAATSGLDSGESGPSRSLPRMSVEGIPHPQTTTVVLDQLEVRLGQRQGGRRRGVGRDRGRGRT
jgi:hypothetical protein